MKIRSLKCLSYKIKMIFLHFKLRKEKKFKKKFYESKQERKNKQTKKPA